MANLNLGRPLLLVALASALILTAPSASALAAPGCTAEQGQAYIDEGSYERAVREFSCLIDEQPTEVEGYRGRIEAELLLGRFSDAVGDYTRLTAFVEPVHPDAQSIIYAHYAARLAAAPDDVPALTGASFARWWFFDYAQAIHLLHRLLDVRPDDLYGNLFRGSSRLLRGATRDRGEEDLERALALDPESADVRFIVADAYTYGLSDPQRALAEATLARERGLETPRIHTILAAAQLALGDPLAAAAHLQQHLELVTTELVTTPAIAPKTALSLALVPGRTYELPIAVTAGETISISTSSHDFLDTILVLLGPDGSPVAGADDVKGFFAALDVVAAQTGTYRVRVTSFESAATGQLLLTRK